VRDLENRTRTLTNPPQPNAGAASALLKLVRNRRVLQRAFNSRVCC